MYFLYIVSVVFIVSVWALYPLLLRGLNSLADGKLKSDYLDSDGIAISIIIAAHNEGDNLDVRIQNIFDGDYPCDKIEVVIASDGSTDNTFSVVEKIKTKYPSIKLIDIQPQGGRSNAHNKAVSSASGDVLVFTDAETLFKKDFLNNLIRPFSNKNVGFSSGVLSYSNAESSDVTKSAGLYWHFEYYLRRLESALGLFVFGSGASCAVRRDLYLEIPPTGDVDFTTPLDVALQGHRCVHVDDAIAYEVMPDTPQREFRSRVRMTAKNLHGTILRWGFKGLLKHPLYSGVIFFHKIGRWLTPFALIALFFSNIYMLGSGFVYLLTFGGQVLFYVLAIMGYFRLPVPAAGAAYSFCLANLGFMIGVLKAVFGRVPAYYAPVSRT